MPVGASSTHCMPKVVKHPPASVTTTKICTPGIRCRRGNAIGWHDACLLSSAGTALLTICDVQTKAASASSVADPWGYENCRRLPRALDARSPYCGREQDKPGPQPQIHKRNASGNVCVRKHTAAEIFPITCTNHKSFVHWSETGNAAGGGSHAPLCSLARSAGVLISTGTIRDRRRRCLAPACPLAG